jgi:cell division septal protein FtsQ
MKMLRFSESKKTKLSRQPVENRQHDRQKVGLTYYTNAQDEATVGRKAYPQLFSRIKKAFSLKKPKNVVFIIILISVAMGLYMMTLKADVEIVVLDGSGHNLRDSDEYGSVAKPFLTGVHRTKATVQTDSIKSAVMKVFPEVNDVMVVTPVFSRTVRIYIKPYQATALVSRGEISYIVDANGTVLASVDTNKAQSTGLSLLKVSDLSTLPISIGDRMYSSDTVRFLVELAKFCQEKQISIQSITLSNIINQIDVSLESGSTYYIKMDVSGEAARQMAAFLATKEELARQGIVPTQYVDVRIEEKVFYL